MGGFAYLLPYSQLGLDVKRVCLSVFVSTEPTHSSISSGCSETQYRYSVKSTVISLKQKQPTRNSPNPSDNQSVTADHCIISCTNILSQQEIH